MAKTIDIRIGTIATTAMVAVPAGKGPFPGVVITFHRGGLDDVTAWMVDNCAAEGFATIAPNHYHVMPPGADVEERTKYITDEQMTLDHKAGAEWLMAQPNVDSSRLALIGTCMGGRATLVGLETYPDLWKCGCIWYGGGCFRQLKGAMPAPGGDDRLKLLACPIMGFYGDLDKNPPPEDVIRLDNLLTAHGKPHEFHRYAEAGHGFLNPYAPDKYVERAAKDSWTRAMAFLKTHLA